MQSGELLLRESRLPLQLRLDTCDVIWGLRPAARVLVRQDNEAELCVNLLLASGLKISVGKGYREQLVVPGRGYVDWFHDGDSVAATIRLAVLYVSSKQEIADAARDADETSNDYVFGIALGYPKCCINWVASRGKVPELKDSFQIYASDGHYMPWIWPGALAIDASLTPHFPCSRACSFSIQLAKARFQAIKRSSCHQVMKHLIDSRKWHYWLSQDGQIRVDEAPPVPGSYIAMATPNGILA